MDFRLIGARLWLSRRRMAIARVTAGTARTRGILSFDMTRKYVEGGRYLVEIEQEARNQDDELSVLGSAVVELPSRS